MCERQGIKHINSSIWRPGADGWRPKLGAPSVTSFPPPLLQREGAGTGKGRTAPSVNISPPPSGRPKAAFCQVRRQNTERRTSLPDFCSSAERAGGGGGKSVVKRKTPRGKNEPLTAANNKIFTGLLLPPSPHFFLAYFPCRIYLNFSIVIVHFVHNGVRSQSAHQS